jgi:hypothetical protein
LTRAPPAAPGETALRDAFFDVVLLEPRLDVECRRKSARPGRQLDRMCVGEQKNNALSHTLNLRTPKISKCKIIRKVTTAAIN